MREILFRGKRIDNGEWVEGSLVNGGGGLWFIAIHPSLAFGPTCKDVINGETLWGFYPFFEVDPSTVGQDTGLIDKNGKKICEGDIVKTHYVNALKADFIEQIVFRNGRFCAKYEGFFNQLRDYSVQIINTGHNVVMDSIEVIGNVHDNPELLKGDTNETNMD